MKLSNQLREDCREIESDKAAIAGEWATSDEEWAGHEADGKMITDAMMKAADILDAAEKALRKLVDEHDPILAARVLGMIEAAQTNYRSPGGGKCK